MQVLGDMFLVFPFDDPVNFGGVYMREQASVGVVVSVGPDVSFRVAVGASIMFRRHAGVLVDIDGARHLAIQERDALLVL